MRDDLGDGFRKAHRRMSAFTRPAQRFQEWLEDLRHRRGARDPDPICSRAKIYEKWPWVEGWSRSRRARFLKKRRLETVGQEWTDPGREYPDLWEDGTPSEP